MQGLLFFIFLGSLFFKYGFCFWSLSGFAKRPQVLGVLRAYLMAWPGASTSSPCPPGLCIVQSLWPLYLGNRFCKVSFWERSSDLIVVYQECTLGLLAQIQIASPPDIRVTLELAF